MLSTKDVIQYLNQHGNVQAIEDMAAFCAACARKPELIPAPQQSKILYAFMIISPFMRCFEKQGRCAAALFLALLSPGRIRKKSLRFFRYFGNSRSFFCEKGII